MSFLVQMFRAIAILASFVGASAFAPAGRMAASSSLRMDFSVSNKQNAKGSSSFQMYTLSSTYRQIS